MTTPVSAVLYVDGIRVADGSPGEDPDAPVALSGLTVNWGRSTTIDQPEPSTCSFELLDPPGSSSFVDLLYTGARVDVTAEGVTDEESGTPGMVDGSFEARIAGTQLDWGAYHSAFMYPNAYIDVSPLQANLGNQSARVVCLPHTIDLGSGNTLVTHVVVRDIPPAPFSTNPSAWDDLPTIGPVESRWEASAAFRLPPYASGGYSIVALPGPTNRNSRTLGIYVADPPDGGPVPQWVTVQFRDLRIGSPATAGMWLAFRISVEPATWNGQAMLRGPSWEDAWGSWDDWRVGYIDDLTVFSMNQPGRVAREVTVFSGRVTDLAAGWDTSTGAVVASVIAADFTADLAQRDVGAEPWPAELLPQRFAHVMAGALPPVTIPYQIAPTLATPANAVSWLDVDRQQVAGLLQDLATSVDGILWSATHRTVGPYYLLADPRTGAALYRLTPAPGSGLIIVVPTQAADNAIELDACDVELDPVVFRQSVSDIATRVAVMWLDQTVNEDGQPAPTERTLNVIDAPAELALGTRRVALSTLLITEDAAATVGSLVLARLRQKSWRVEGLVWSTFSSGDDEDGTPPGYLSMDKVGRVLDLLDGTRRLGVAVLLDNLPDWTPAAGGTLPLMLQGGRYAYTDGAWVLELRVASAAAQGASISWEQLHPAYPWLQFDPSVAWDSLIGVAP